MAIIDPSFRDWPKKISLALESLSLAESDSGSRIDWAGNIGIPVTGTPEMDDEKFTEGGTTPIRKVVISVRTAELKGGMPQKQQMLTYYPGRNSEGRPYRIASIENNWDAWLKLTCESPNAGA